MQQPKLESLYASMLFIRRAEEAIASEYKKGHMRCPTHFSIGQEAVAVGVCSNLHKEDIVFSTHRSHAHYLAKGGSLPRLIAELYGKKTGCSGGYGGSMRLIDTSVNFWGSTPIVANSIPVAVGVALASKKTGIKRLTVAFFGEAATEEGVFYESANFAALHALPVLFICENNLYSVNTRLEDRQPPRKRIDLTSAVGIESFEEDGNDIEGVNVCINKVAARMRKDGKPRFIEFNTYRQRVHCGPDEDTDRPKEEIEYWKQKDPLSIWSSRYTLDDIANIEKEIKVRIQKAFMFANKSPYPTPEYTKYVYA